jgi:hypothetical protein
MPTPDRKRTVTLALEKLGWDPLEFLVSVARDPRCNINLACDISKELLKYCYSRKSDLSIEMETTVEPINTINGVPITEIMKDRKLSRQIEDIQIQLAAERQRLRQIEAAKPTVIDVEPE